LVGTSVSATIGTTGSSGTICILTEVGKAGLAVLTGTSGAIGSSRVRGGILTRSSRVIGTCGVLTKIGSSSVLATRIVVLAGSSVFAGFARVSEKSFCCYSSS